MVTRSLFTGVSGLQAHLSKMDTLSDNISNINTPGFKKSQTVFKSFLSQTVQAASRPTESRGGTNPQEVGLGVQVGSITKDMSQGQLERTGIDTDLAIQGDGFFETRESGGNNNLYTRAGSFQIDANGRLVDPSNGNVVQGFNSTIEDGEIVFNPDTATVDDIQITPSQEVIPGESTTEQSFSGNLNANGEKGIEPVNIDFENSQVRFEFERYHPVEKMYRFTAKWTQNPPSGKQIGDNVTDQITGRDLQGIMQLNDDGQVTDIFDNPDLSGKIGAARVEVDRENAGDFNISTEEMSIRDQNGFMEDLAPDVTDQFRIRFISDQAAPAGNANGDDDEFVVEWRDSDGGWNQFQNFENTGNPADLGVANQDFVMRRTTGTAPGGDQRDGEIRISSDFWNTMDTSSIQGGAIGGDDGDKIYFQTHEGDGNEMLNQTGEEVMKEFRWGGQNSAGVGTMRVSSPETITGGGTLNSVFNYDEANLDQISDTAVQNDIQNKEFRIEFNQGNATDFQVFADQDGDGNVDDALQNPNGAPGPQIFTTDDDAVLETSAAAPGGAGLEIGISIASENWSGTANNDVYNFQVTESRSSDSGRPFMIASDGNGNETALFAPSGGSGGSNQPSNINFGPNLNDTSGILNDTTGTFTDLLAASGSAAEADAKADDEVQIATSSDVFDSLGDQHTLTYRFERKGSNEWMWHAVDPTPVDDQNPEIAGFGRLNFNERGGIESSEIFSAKTAQELPPPGPSGDLDLRRVYFNPPEGELQSDPADPDSQNQDVGAAPVSILPDFSDVTQFAGDSDVEISDQDGTSRGRLESLSFDTSGVLNGAYDNGNTEQLAQVVLADFRNPAGLEKAGSTYFAQSANSGIPTRGKPGSGGRGTITPGALERSNVDLSDQFTQLIGTQRGFQANTRTISAADQLVQSVLQLV